MSCLVSAYCYLNNIVAVCQFICLFEIIKVDGPQNAFLNVYVSYRRDGSWVGTIGRDEWKQMGGMVQTDGLFKQTGGMGGIGQTG